MIPEYTVGLTVAQISELLTDDDGGSTGDNEKRAGTWSYGGSGQPSEPSHHAEFLMVPKDVCFGTQFEVTSSFGSYSAGRVEMSGTYQIPRQQDCGSLNSTNEVKVSSSDEYERLSDETVQNRPDLREVLGEGPIYRKKSTPPLELVEFSVNTTPADEL